jgi:hypothetical protein
MSNKKSWAAPQMTVYGTVEKITEKSLSGVNDGLFLNVDTTGTYGTSTDPNGGSLVNIPLASCPPCCG